MRKAEFLHTLERNLSALPAEARRDILADFEEHFTTGQSLGKTEEEVARELGDPQALAGQYVEAPPQINTSRSIVQGILAALALLLFDVILALPVLGVLFSIWLSLWAVALSVAVAGLAGMVFAVLPWSLVVPGVLAHLGVFLLGVAAVALGVLMGIGLVYVTKWSFQGLTGFLKAHVRIIKGGT